MNKEKSHAVYDRLLEEIVEVEKCTARIESRLADLTTFITSGMKVVETQHSASLLYVQASTMRAAIASSKAYLDVLKRRRDFFHPN